MKKLILSVVAVVALGVFWSCSQDASGPISTKPDPLVVQGIKQDLSQVQPVNIALDIFTSAKVDPTSIGGVRIYSNTHEAEVLVSSFTSKGFCVHVAQPLQYDSVYTFEASGLKSVDGGEQDAIFRTWFRAASAPVPLWISYLVPEDGDTISAAAVAAVAITFNQVIDPSTFNSSTVLLQGADGTYLDAVRNINGANGSIAPRGGFSSGGYYGLHLTDGVKTLEDQHLPSTVVWFWTAAESLPVPVSEPAPGDTSVAFRKNVIMTFAKDIDPTTVDSTTVWADIDGVKVPVERSVNANRVFVGPTAYWSANSLVRVHVTAGVKSTSGEPVTAHTFSFRTEKGGKGDLVFPSEYDFVHMTHYNGKVYAAVQRNNDALILCIDPPTGLTDWTYSYTDGLNEMMYVAVTDEGIFAISEIHPGNPEEGSYYHRLDHSGQPLIEGLLLTTNRIHSRGFNGNIYLGGANQSTGIIRAYDQSGAQIGNGDSHVWDTVEGIYTDANEVYCVLRGNPNGVQVSKFSSVLGHQWTQTRSDGINSSTYYKMQIAKRNGLVTAYFLNGSPGEQHAFDHSYTTTGSFDHYYAYTSVNTGIIKIVPTPTLDYLFPSGQGVKSGQVMNAPPGYGYLSGAWCPELNQMLLAKQNVITRLSSY